MCGAGPRHVTFAPLAETTAFTATSPPTTASSWSLAPVSVAQARRHRAPSPASPRTQRRLAQPSLRAKGAAASASRALQRAAELAIIVSWSGEDDQELSIAVEDAAAHPRPLTDTILAIHAAVPHQPLASIATRWIAMSHEDGLMCPPTDDLQEAIRYVHRITTPPSPGHTRSPSPVSPDPPLPPLPPDILGSLFSRLRPRDLASAARVCSAWHAPASCHIHDLAIGDAVEDLILDVCSIMSDYEPVQGIPGTCVGCGVPNAAFRGCLSCGAPVEPDDGSWHYMFGWVEGPRPGE